MTGKFDLVDVECAADDCDEMVTTTRALAEHDELSDPRCPGCATLPDFDEYELDEDGDDD